MAIDALLTDKIILDRVTKFIVTNFLFGDFSKTPAVTDSLIETGIMDSTGILELIEYIETEFSIEVGENETIPQNLDGLAVLTKFISSKVARIG